MMGVLSSSAQCLSKKGLMPPGPGAFLVLTLRRCLTTASSPMTRHSRVLSHKRVSGGGLLSGSSVVIFELKCAARSSALPWLSGYHTSVVFHPPPTSHTTCRRVHHPLTSRLVALSPTSCPDQQQEHGGSIYRRRALLTKVRCNLATYFPFESSVRKEETTSVATAVTSKERVQ